MEVNFLAAIIAAIFVKAIVDYAKPLWQASAKSALISQLVAIGLGVAICVLGNIDMLEMAGLSLNAPVVGAAISGVIVSGGANIIYDIADGIKNRKTGE
jgi:hypothetical protein